jgi:hypothetical protein
VLEFGSFPLFLTVVVWCMSSPPGCGVCVCENAGSFRCFSLSVGGAPRVIDVESVFSSNGMEC